MFLDADDFLADNAVLDRFVNVMKHEEADIVVGNYERLWNGRRFAAASHTSFSELNPDSEDFRFQGFFSVGTLSYVWGKLYRKQFLEKNEAVFENLPYAEDKLFNILFDTWEEYFNYDRWLDAFKTCGLDPDFYNYRTIGLDEVTPWDHLDVGVTKAHLVREYNKALEAKTTQPCNRQCSACGANKLIGGPCFDYSKNLL